ncbi:conserved hypothetical protein [Theileria equi strain WA]|uniref:Uncharacterized protein n=1 Tax=Theileria equi strain WA TaxID=1537102 RepID=L1LA79_THEEQ|nr:conserved hypothetical protein [Theileria equi strain WA]EKX72352.1 conserved hypothetical protein [Theileria equi strain WA]|eukprot:XP_004831804.1 conserved hypothetical protein [Theileria equi strain WA]
MGDTPEGEEEAEMSQKEGDTGNGSLKKAVAFLSGLALYQLPHAAISAGNFTVGRFQIPQQYVGLYINRMIIPYRIFSLLGVAVLTAYDQTGSTNIDKITVGLFWGVIGCYIALLLTYCSGGIQGHLTLYYWMVILASAIVGAAFVGIVKALGDDVTYLLVALPVSGILASSYHISFIVISQYFNFSNIYYWLVFWQWICAISLIAAVSVLVWTFMGKTSTSTTTTVSSSSSGSDSGGSSTNGGFLEALGNAISPLLLVAFGYGIQNMFYPSVAPYKIIGIDRGYKIDVAVLITSAVPPLLFLYLISKGQGPNVKWTEGNAHLWHYAWAFFGIEIFCGMLFFSTLHYPNSAMPRAIKDSIWGLGFFTVLYDFSVQMTRCIGSNGVDKQGGKDAPKMNTLNTFIYSFSQVLFAFLGDGYIRTYRKAEESSDLWPTAHYTTRRAFWYWTWSTAKVSFSNVGTAFTRDVRGAIQTKKEHLFIVYDDAPPEGDPFFDLPFIKKKEPSKDNHSLKGAHIFH